jgi:hypothetical protein
VRTYLLILAICATAACKGKPKTQAAPGAGKVEVQGSGGKAPKEIDLPHADGSPPVKTTGPVKPETFKKMSEMTFPGFNLDVRALTDKYMWLYQKTPESPVIRASVHIWPCVGNPKDCWPLDVETFKKDHMDELKQYLTPGLKKAPDTQFEVGETELNGQKMIYTFQLGEVLGGEHNEFTYAYVLYYNDGHNEIRVLGEYKDDLMGKKEDMAKAIPRVDLENTAKAFLDVYTHHWQE